jgi:hypothetical protein
MKNIQKGVDAIGRYDKFKSNISDVDQRLKSHAKNIDQANIFE